MMIDDPLPIPGKKRYPLDGYNPLRHDCVTQGCFVTELWPQSELFTDCFPGKNSFGNIDAAFWVERFGHLLFLEWKRPKESLSVGQSKMFVRITAKGRYNTVIVVVGDAKSARVDRYTVYWQGHIKSHIGNLEELKDRVFDWNIWAQRNSLIPRTA